MCYGNYKRIQKRFPFWKKLTARLKPCDEKKNVFEKDLSYQTWITIAPISTERLTFLVESSVFDIFLFGPRPPWMCYWCSILHLSCCHWTIYYFVQSLNNKVWTAKLRWDEETETEWWKERCSKGEKRFSFLLFFCVFLWWSPLWQVKLPSLLCSAPLRSTLRGLLLYK